ncbi:MAG TPA: restriction endonuclease [Candidatus Acidoferrales bacterium]|nr:restriction endonuclease [Candidatus Acidoferrales bacterium]
MPPIPNHQIHAGLQQIVTAAGTAEKGRALENFVCELFPFIPGIEIAQRNALNAFETEELDVALWNARHQEGLYFLPNILLVECKNWSNPVGSQEVSYFVQRLRHRGCDHGILFATNGITGVPADLTRAHYEIAAALESGTRVMVVTSEDIADIAHSDALVSLLKLKLCQLVVSGTNFL